MKRPGLLVALVLGVGLAGTVVALTSREGNAQFVAQQQALLPVSAAAVQRLLLTTSDPRPGHRGRASAASCVAATATALGNPWTCFVSYPAPPRIRFTVTVRADRSISGAGRPEDAGRGVGLTVRGCCVGAP